MFFDKILTKIFGTANERTIKRLMPVVAEINDLEPGIQQLTDEHLRAKTVEFRRRIADRVEERLKGIESPEQLRAEGREDEARDAEERRAVARAEAERAALDEILPEAFAVVREAGWRAVEMRHFDVQLIGGMVLHQGKIAEMKTGEGKAGGHAELLFECAGRPRGSRSDGERLPGQARRRMDGQDLRVPGADRGGDRPRPGRRGAPRGLSSRHYLWNE